MRPGEAVSVHDLAASAPAGVEVAAATHIGPVRTENQDAFGATALEGGGIAIVLADGMGGHPGGAEAATVATRATIETLRAGPASEAAMTAALEAANVAVGVLRDEIRGHPGTTLTVTAIEGRRAVLGHAGDSRAYLVRDGVAAPLTSDHSWVGDRVRAGELEPGSERRHPRRNVITMAVMGEPITPEVRTVHLAAGDVLVLCSDGFWEPLEDTTIATLVGGDGSLAEAAGRAVEAALEAGGSDNVTLVALRLSD